MQTLPYVMEATSKSNLVSFLKGQPSYPQVINYLLGKYANDENIVKGEDEINDLYQNENQKTSDLAVKVRQPTNRCGCEYQPKHVIEVFLHGL